MRHRASMNVQQGKYFGKNVDIIGVGKIFTRRVSGDAIQNTTVGPLYLFPPFPLSNEALLEQWLSRIGASSLDPLQHLICSLHFTQEDFDQRMIKKRLVLRSKAVPSIFPRSIDKTAENEAEEEVQIIQHKRATMNTESEQSPNDNTLYNMANKSMTKVVMSQVNLSRRMEMITLNQGAKKIIFDGNKKPRMLKLPIKNVIFNGNSPIVMGKKVTLIKSNGLLVKTPQKATYAEQRTNINENKFPIVTALQKATNNNIVVKQEKQTMYTLEKNTWEPEQSPTTKDEMLALGSTEFSQKMFPNPQSLVETCYSDDNIDKSSSIAHLHTDVPNEANEANEANNIEDLFESVEENSEESMDVSKNCDKRFPQVKLECMGLRSKPLRTQENFHVPEDWNPDVILVQNVPNKDSIHPTVSRYPGNKKPVLRILIDSVYDEPEPKKRRISGKRKADLGKTKNTKNHPGNKDAPKEEITIENSAGTRRVTFKLDPLTGQIVMESQDINNVSENHEQSVPNQTKRKAKQLPAASTLNKLHAQNERECKALRRKLKIVENRHKKEEREIAMLRKKMCGLEGKFRKSIAKGASPV